MRSINPANRPTLEPQKNWLKRSGGKQAMDTEAIEYIHQSSRLMTVCHIAFQETASSRHEGRTGPFRSIHQPSKRAHPLNILMLLQSDRAICYCSIPPLTSTPYFGPLGRMITSQSLFIPWSLPLLFPPSTLHHLIPSRPPAFTAPSPFAPSPSPPSQTRLAARAT